MVLNFELHSNSNLLHVHSLPSAFQQINMQWLFAFVDALNTEMNYFHFH